MGTLLQDVRFGLRMLAKNPGFTAVAVITLALGIGANTAIFSLVNGVLLRPLPYPEPDRLVMVYETSKEFNEMSASYLNYQDWRRDSHSFEKLAATRYEALNLTGAGEPEYLNGRMVSADFFSILGVKPVLGRDFSPAEDQLGAAPVAMISAGLWKRRFGADPGVVGKTLTLNGTDYTVVGVLPADFRFSGPSDLFILLGQWNNELVKNRAIHPGIRVVARLKPRVTMAQATAEMQAIGRRLAEQYPEANAGHGVNVKSLMQDMVGDVRPTLVLLWAAVGFVLLVACANVANLLLARSSARQRELAIRSALGAGRIRIIRQLLTESVLLALAGGGLGLMVAAWGIRPILAAVPGSLPRAQDIGIDANVLLFALGGSVLTGILFGLAPAFEVLRGDLQSPLKEGGRGVAGGRHRVQGSLVVSEVALSLLLLTAAGLMIRTLRSLWQVKPGFDPQHVATMQVALSPSLTKEPARIPIAYQQLLARVRAIPGIEAAAATAMVPLNGDDNEIPFWTGAGPEPSFPEMPSALTYITTPGYEQTMRIPLLQGRYLNEADNSSGRMVVLIDEVLAHHYFPAQNPVGKQMKMALLGPVEIVGVVGHVKHWGLDSDDTSKIRDQIYFPLAQIPVAFMDQAATGLTLVLRTQSDPLSVIPAVSREVLGPAKDQPVHNVQTMEQIVGTSLARRRFLMLLLGGFASVALLLAAVGIYGVISYAVAQRTQEIGIRMALGAERGDVLRLVVGRGILLILSGVAIGIVGALALTRFLSSMLYGVRSTDLVTYLVVSLILAGVGVLACYIPARRATKVDPMVALRYE